jgi:hypothetical protein
MHPIPTLTAFTALLALAGPAMAQAEAPPALSLELNALTQVEAACRVSFVAGNRMGAAIADATFEVAFFGRDGILQKLVSLDFKALPVAKTKVVQFDLDGLSCADVGRVLVNDVATCDGVGLDPATCLAALTTSHRPDVDFGT